MRIIVRIFGNYEEKNAHEGAQIGKRNKRRAPVFFRYQIDIIRK